MSSLVAGTVRAVASTSQVLSGAYELSRKLLDLLRPSSIRLDPEDAHYIYCIQRQIECILRPYEFCVIWNQYRDPVSQHSVMLVEDTLRRVWNEIYDLEKQSLNVANYSSLIIPTASSHNQQGQCQTIKDDTSSKYMVSHPYYHTRLTNDKHSHSMSSTNRLKWCVEELQIATTQLSLSLSTIQAYHQSISTIQTPTLSVATLVKATQLLWRMEGKTGDICLRSGCLYYLLPDVLYMNEKKIKQLKVWKCIYTHCFFRIVKTQEGRHFPASIVIEEHAHTKDKHHNLTANQQQQYYLQHKNVQLLNSSLHQQEKSLSNSIISSDILLESSQFQDTLTPQIDHSNDFLNEDEFLFISDDFPNYSVNNYVPKYDSSLTTHPSNNLDISHSKHVLKHNRPLDQTVPTLDDYMTHPPYEICFPIETALSMKLQTKGLHRSMFKGKDICLNKCHKTHRCITRQLKNRTRSVSDPGSYSNTEHTTKQYRGIIHETEEIYGPALIWTVTSTDINQTHSIKEQQYSWLHYLLQTMNHCEIDSQDNEIKKCNQQITFAFIFNAEQQHMPLPFNTLGLHDEYYKQHIMKKTRYYFNYCSKETSIYERYSIQPLEMLYIARLSYLEAACHSSVTCQEPSDPIELKTVQEKPKKLLYQTVHMDSNQDVPKKIGPRSSYTIGNLWNDLSDETLTLLLHDCIDVE